MDVLLLPLDPLAWVSFYRSPTYLMLKGNVAMRKVPWSTFGNLQGVRVNLNVIILKEHYWLLLLNRKRVVVICALLQVCLLRPMNIRARPTCALDTFIVLLVDKRQRNISWRTPQCVRPFISKAYALLHRSFHG